MPNSVFPPNIDTFVMKSEIDSTNGDVLMPKVIRYRYLKQNYATLTSDEIAEYASLSTELAPYICSTADWNLLCEAITNVENAYAQIISNVNQQITDAMSAPSGSIYTYVNNILQLKVPFNVVYSATQPTSPTEGTLWLKPKTT